MNFRSFLIPITIYKTQSSYNGSITVVESFGKRYLYSDGTMQSGPYLQNIWKKGLKKLGIEGQRISRVLILGFGSGSFASSIRSFFPDTSITAIEIDEVMVDIYHKFFKLSTDGEIEILIGDAQKKLATLTKKYDLIFVDLYRGYTIPAFVQSLSFLSDLEKHTNPHGSIIFNLVHFGPYKKNADEIVGIIKKEFSTHKIVDLRSNIFVYV